MGTADPTTHPLHPRHVREYKEIRFGAVLDTAAHTASPLVRKARWASGNDAT